MAWYVATTSGVCTASHTAARVAGTYWFGTGHFDLTTTQTVNGAVEVSGSWAAATSVGYVQA